jgi:hypothetical protein
MDVCAVFHVVLSRKKKGEERVGVGGRGKYPGAPPHIKRKKRKKPTARYLIDQYGEKEKAIKKKKIKINCHKFKKFSCLIMHHVNKVSKI